MAMNSKILNLTFCFLYSFFALGQKPKQPNIIIFLVDDMGLMDTSVPFLIGKNGNPTNYPLNKWYRTPNMERLAALGTRFSTFYAQSVCSPSRMSLITGQNATRHHTTQWIDPNQNNRGEFGPKNWNWQGLSKKNTSTLPQLLQKHGYSTIYIGKAHLGPFGSVGENPLNLGFDVNIGGTAIGHPGSYLGMENYAQKTEKGAIIQQVPHLQKYHQTDTFLTEALTIEALNEINKAVNNQKPFFLQMAHYAVHSPFTFDPKYEQNYKTEKYSKEAQQFASMIEGMDHSLGQIMEELEAKGIAENTLILFLGDNGSDAPLGPTHEVGSSAPLRGKKGTHYEGGMRTPLIVAWAKPNKKNEFQEKLPVKSGAIQTQLTTIMDIYPTILDLLSIQKPSGYPIDGQSLAKNLTGKWNSAKPETFLMHFPHDHRSKYFTNFRKNNWKLVYHYYPQLNPANTKYELFDLASDPYEQINLSKIKPKKVLKMVEEMKLNLVQQQALFPIDSNGNALMPK